MKRSNMINNRYQVFCVYCGQLSTERTKRDAMSAAASYANMKQGGHFTNPCEVRVADLMATIGSVELWRVTRKGIQIIGRKS